MLCARAASVFPLGWVAFAAVVVAVELLYFEREWLVEEVREVGPGF